MIVVGLAACAAEPADDKVVDTSTDTDSDSVLDTDSSVDTDESDTSSDFATQAQAVCDRWNTDRQFLDEGGWTGDVASCDLGTLSQVARDNTIRQINLYRWLAGGDPVVEDTANHGATMACSLMQQANPGLSHTPPSSWSCYSSAGADAAGKSNISTQRTVGSVAAYMLDNGNATTIGHRRWIIGNWLGGSVAVGSTSGASCMGLFGAYSTATPGFVAWPPPGIVPIQAVSQVDMTGWTVQSDQIALANASVAVTRQGAEQPVSTVALLENYGSRYAIRFNPSGWASEAGATYAVTVTGVAEPIAFEVTFVDCDAF